MADVTIEAALVTTQPSTRWFQGPVYVSALVGYAFFIDANNDLAYRKTTDGGATWGSPVVVFTGTVQGLDWQYERDVSNRTIIGLSWTDNGDRLRYRPFDPFNGDALGTQVDVSSPPMNGANGWTDTIVTLIRAQGGSLFANFKCFNSGTTAGNLFRSQDNGANWSDRTTTPYETGGDLAVLLPGNTADLNDLAILYLDTSALAISVKMYDDSANTYTETAIGTAAAVNADYMLFHGIFSPATGLIYLASFSEFNTGTADLNFWTITPNSIASPTVTAKTNVLTNTAGAVSPRVAYDEASGTITVFYLRGTVDSSMTEFYKTSTDGGTNWSAEQTFQQGSAANFRTQDVHGLIRSGDGGRIQPAWRANTNQDLITNAVNGFAVVGNLPLAEPPLFAVRNFDVLKKITAIALSGPGLGGQDQFFGALGQGPPPQFARIIPPRQLNRSFAEPPPLVMIAPQLPPTMPAPYRNLRTWPRLALVRMMDLGSPVVLIAVNTPQIQGLTWRNPRVGRTVVRATVSQGLLPVLNPPPPPVGASGPAYIPIYRRRRRGP